MGTHWWHSPGAGVGGEGCVVDLVLLQSRVRLISEPRDNPSFQQIVFIFLLLLELIQQHILVKTFLIEYFILNAVLC